MNIRKFSTLAVVLFCLFGCNPGNDDDISQREADQLFASAKRDIANQSYESAIKSLENIQINYPQYAEYDHLLYLLAKSQYAHKDYLEAQNNAHEFINSNPATKNTEEMMFVEAMSQFLLNDNWLEGRLLSPRHLRDTAYIEKSKDNFVHFKKQYPKSKYIPQVNKALAQTKEILANSELEIAKYDYNHKAYLGAIHRAETVIKEFPNTPQYHEALKVMDNSFYKLGLTQEYNELKRKIERNAKA